MAGTTRNKGNLKSIIFAIFFVSLVLFYFQHLSNKTASRKSESQKSELENLSDYDMDKEYPKTARDAIKLHNRYFKIFYGQSVKDDDLAILNKKVRMLYSKELLSYNPENGSLDKLKKDIDKMKSNKYTYKSYELPEGSQVKYYEQNGQKMATAEVKMNVSVSGEAGYLYVQYVLVEEDGLWKILAWGDSKLGHNEN